MPKAPLMPGVIICEVAAQLASYFTQKYDLLGAKVVGFGGLEEVKFRGGVVPGDRLVMVVQLAESPPRGDDCLPLRGLCGPVDGRRRQAEGNSASAGFGSARNNAAGRADR